MPKNIYLVKLFPRNGKFFFGNAPVFVEASTEFYLHQSAKYPLQTSILGFVQGQILEQNNLLELSTQGEQIKDLSQAQEFIGAANFNATPEQNFGAIHRISPVFITQKGTDYILKERKEATFGTHKQVKICLEDEVIENPNLLELKNAKDVVEMKIEYQGEPNEELEGECETQRYTQYFKENIPYEAGVNKEKQELISMKPQQKNQEGYFKNQFGYFEPQADGKEFGFCFYVELDDTLTFATTPNVGLGKERNVCSFLMEVELHSGGATPFENPCVQSSTKQIRLLSDAYLPDAIWQYCQTALSEARAVKYLKRDTIEAKISGWALSEEKNMFKRGSIFCLKPNLKPEQIAALNQILNQQPYQKIGYNYFEVE